MESDERLVTKDSPKMDAVLESIKTELSSTRVRIVVFPETVLNVFHYNTNVRRDN